MGYGFSLSDNPSDHYSLGFSPAISAYIKATKGRRLARKSSSDAVQSQNTQRSENIPSAPVNGLTKTAGQVLESSQDFNVEEILEQNIHWVRLRGNESYEFSPKFLEYFSIAVENPREAHIADISSVPMTHFHDREFSRNQLHVICAVIMILQKGQRAICKHDKDLFEAPRNCKQVDAKRYRDSQLKILDTVLDSICTFLKSITSANSPKVRDLRVLRLEDTLTNSPKSLLKDLRGVLNAGVRTRDPIKIRERGGVDFAFTVWLCGLWVYSQSDVKEEEAAVDSTYLRWLLFLQNNYPQPSEISIGLQRLENPILEERAAWFDPVRSASGDAEQDSAMIAKSYLDAVHAATQKRPQSLYNDDLVTVERLAWCYNIIKNEGVWCPNLDQGEDEEDDDWVIFIELGEP